MLIKDKKERGVNMRVFEVTREKSDLLATKLLEMVTTYVNEEQKLGSKSSIGVEDIKRAGFVIMCIQGAKKADDKYWMLNQKQATIYMNQNVNFKQNLLVNNNDLVNLYKQAELIKTTKASVKVFRDNLYAYLNVKATELSVIKERVLA